VKFGDRLRVLRKEHGMTQQDLAEALGCAKSTISMYEKNQREPSFEVIEALADIFNVPIARLMENTTTAPVKNPPIRIPVLGSIPAGIPMEAIEDILDWEELPASMGKGGAQYFALRIKGDSMSPPYLDGDVLIFRKQETCNSGQDCAVMVNGDDATFKRVKISDRGITLQPLNPAYDPMYFTHKECAEVPVRILGVVAELRRKF